jgi:ribosome biogenesis GTPase / thiamine phosphate phosphatase
MEDRCLEKLGYNEWIQDINVEGIKDGFSLARVIEVNKDRYIVSDGRHEMIAEISGKFKFDASGSVDFPTIGDWVEVQIQDNYSLAIINSILPRKTLLKRKESGKRIDFQLIAANIDFGLVMQSADLLNLNLLDRYFVMLNESNIQPIAVFNKIDLLSPSELAILKNNLSSLKKRYLLISNVTDSGIDELSKSLLPGKTYCLLGQSGVGKTSLLNNLLRTKMFKVNEVREKDGRGRHTTVSRQLICLDAGSIFIDTPGIRELGNFEIEEGLDQTFEELASYAQKCHFRDCTHVHEKGCAVIEAVKNGEIEEKRYNNYLKLRKESQHYKTLYHEKRKKDKSFGKMIKNYKKHKKKY